MDAANAELSIGIASGAGKIGATPGKRKAEKLHTHKDAVKKDAIKIAK